MRYVYISCCLYLIFLLGIGCKKQNDFLNEKPSASLSTITSLSDCQLLLQNTSIFNDADAALGELATDDYYLSPSAFEDVTITEQNSYLWANVIYPAGTSNIDFLAGYRQIYYANVVLDALPTIGSSGNQDLYNSVKGTALFFRSMALYNMVQTFALPYDSMNAAQTLGVPIPLTSNINQSVTRATEQACYQQIIGDLTTAIGILPSSVSSITLPSQTAGYALLARIYLAMGSYLNAYNYANLTLNQNNKLVDYNTLPSGAVPMITSGFISEDIFHSTLYNYIITSAFASPGVVDSNLYALYSPNDLRQSLFFLNYSGNLYWNGTYDYQGNAYSGLATDEMYLIRAEALVRNGNVPAGVGDLNTLLINRYLKNTYVRINTNNQDTALAFILQERRKELVFRGLRWTDLRRLNQDKTFAVTLNRVLNGASYNLLPNDSRYAYPFDDQEIQLTNIQQNER
jgi:hypothetical protein